MRISHTGLAVLAMAGLLAGPAQASGRDADCRPTVDSELARLQVAADRVAGISLQERRYSNRNDNSRLQGVLGWVDLRDCDGRLVVDMAPGCRVKQVYTNGQCAVPGVPAY